jgi:hypothetical protein
LLPHEAKYRWAIQCAESIQFNSINSIQFNLFVSLRCGQRIVMRGRCISAQQCDRPAVAARRKPDAIRGEAGHFAAGDQLVFAKEHQCAAVHVDEHADALIIADGFALDVAANLALAPAFYAEGILVAVAAQAPEGPATLSDFLADCKAAGQLRKCASPDTEGLVFR